MLLLSVKYVSVTESVNLVLVSLSVLTIFKISINQCFDHLMEGRPSSNSLNVAFYQWRLSGLLVLLVFGISASTTYILH